jgi:hypothetical protein
VVELVDIALAGVVKLADIALAGRSRMARVVLVAVPTGLVLAGLEVADQGVVVLVDMAGLAEAAGLAKHAVIILEHCHRTNFESFLFDESLIRLG